MKAGDQARLELPINLGYASVDFCMCENGRSEQVGRGVDTSNHIRWGHLDGASSGFTACMHLCFLVAA